MKHLSLILFALSVPLLLAGCQYIPQNAAQPTPTPLVMATPAPFIAPASWQTAQTPAFSLRYPPEAKADTRSNQTVITYIGDAQRKSGRTQTELFDGYAVRVEAAQNPDKKTVTELMETEKTSSLESCPSGKGSATTEQTMVSGIEGTSYLIRGCMTDVTVTFVPVKDAVYRIEQHYVGTASDQPIYEQVTKQIRDSIVFQ